MLVKSGIFTLRAKALCFECHGPHLPVKSLEVPSEEWTNLTQPRDLDDYNGVTRCVSCSDEIQIMKELAYENNLMLELRALGYEAIMAFEKGVGSFIQVFLQDWNSIKIGTLDGQVWNVELEDTMAVNKTKEDVLALIDSMALLLMPRLYWVKAGEPDLLSLQDVLDLSPATTSLYVKNTVDTMVKEHKLEEF